MTMPIPARDPNSTSNPEFVKALQDGLPKLWDGTGVVWDGYSEEYICSTIDNLKLQRLIESRLYKKGAEAAITYRGWAKRFSNKEFTSEELQAGRKAWMLDLIEEFS